MMRIYGLPHTLVLLIACHASFELRSAPIKTIGIIVAGNGAQRLSTGVPDGGARVRGRVVFDGSALRPPADPSRLLVFTWDITQEALWRQIEVFRAPNIFPVAAVKADGTFEIAGLSPGVYAIEVGRVPAGWRLRSALKAGSDVLDTMLKVDQASGRISDLVLVFTDRGTMLTGLVAPPSSLAETKPTVIAFPADGSLRQSRRRVKTASVDLEGRFTFRNLPAGEYLVAALAGPEKAEVTNAGFLESLAIAAARVTLAEGEAQMVVVKGMAMKRTPAEVARWKVETWSGVRDSDPCRPKFRTLEPRISLSP